MKNNKENIKLTKKNLVLKIFLINHITKEYINWLNDKKVVKYTEQRFLKHNESSVKKFVSKNLNSKKNYLFGIYFKKKHVGNIKLGPINKKSKKSDISYIIGKRKLWNKGIATNSISMVSSFAFKVLNLKTLRAGSYLSNIGSIKVLKKNGFVFSKFSTKNNKKTIFLVKMRN